MTAGAPPWRLDGRVALVTGGSAGIGLATARALAGAGARVVITARNEERLRAAAEGIDGGVAWIVAHAGRPEDAARAIEFTTERFGSLDILVNNVATNPYFGPTLGITDEQAMKTMSVNQLAALRWTQLAWDAGLKESPHGSVVNVASVGAFFTRRNIGIYNMTKAGIVHLTAQLADELGPRVRVNAVAPGLIKTELARALWEKREAAVVAMTPLGRLGEVTDVANAVLFLASDMSSWITGHTMVIDGGVLAADPTVDHGKPVS